jgi:hypothetical protein
MKQYTVTNTISHEQKNPIHQISKAHRIDDLLH